MILSPTIQIHKCIDIISTIGLVILRDITITGPGIVATQRLHMKVERLAALKRETATRRSASSIACPVAAKGVKRAEEVSKYCSL